MKYSKQEQAEALERLHGWVKPGDTVHCILRNVSRSGMQREIGVVLMSDRTAGPIHPNHAFAVVFGERLGKRDGVIVGGCGMDMGFHLVYSVSRRLFPDGFGIEGEGSDGKKYRPVSKADAEAYVRQGVKFRGRNGDASGWDNDGGYALRHSWL